MRQALPSIPARPTDSALRRFSESPAIKGPDASRSPGLYGVPFADKAKSMLIPMLGYSSTRTVQSLLLLSWHEFGLNNDGSFWNFTGMALRMAQDLGLHLVRYPPSSALQLRWLDSRLTHNLPHRTSSTHILTRRLKL